ncbi:Polysaccharide deacetylase domain protein [Coleofasciculus chthonoplastes PCC 7420]|uniref:Polysaccharide deacetylase domain protein n=1 Tax=Coleofasciculus chthonoplastes PCC 7420 TaxID=118168 RepID=B4W3Z7_9CYAN|nr:polysaccharide deacetylase family protein [Coleofasciculus chthonoplastes]EDX71068.1 Polysaccharide deacetylase domain protein [Coleofasciculus chthonoplastes PCC 7420]
MANPCQLVWQYRLSISLIAATLGFIASLSVSVARSVNPKLAIPSPNLNQQEQLNSKMLQINGLIGEEQEIYQQMLAYLAEEEAKRLTFSVPVEFQGKTIRSRVLNNKAKVIALTFDDGPSSETTPQVLDILQREGIKATFFVVGKTVKNHPQLLKQIVADGHAIGNHTWNHHYHQYSPWAAAQELETTAQLIHKLTGVKTALFRPPAGILNNGLVNYAHQKKYAVIMWSADTKDWQSRRITVPKLINNALEDAQPGGIILLHDGGGDRSKTVQALPKLITELKQRGYQFVTVPELLDMPD